MSNSVQTRQSEQDKKSFDMTVGPIKSKMVRFAIPIFIGNLFQQLYNAVDSLVVGNFVGSTALAAVSSTGTLIYLLVGFFYGIAMGAGVVIARYIGAKDARNASLAVHTTVAVGIIASIILTVFGVLATPTLLRWMDTPDDVMPEAVIYLRIYFAGITGLVMYNIFVGIMQAAGDSRHPLYYLIFSSCLNIVLDLLFIVGFGAGVAGAAIATVISQVTSAILLLIRLTRTTEIYGVKLREIRIDKAMAGSIIQIGIPSGVQNSAHALSNVVIQFYINGYGSAAMAGLGAYAKVEGFAMLPLNSFAMAITTFTSQNLGAKEKDRVDRGIRFGLLGGIIVNQAIGLVLFVFCPQLLAMFDSTPDVIAYGVGRCRVATPFFFLFAYTQLMSSVLRGCGHATEPMAVFIVCWCVMRILIMAIGSSITDSIALIYWVYPVTWLLSSIVLALLWKKVKKTI